MVPVGNADVDGVPCPPAAGGLADAAPAPTLTEAQVESRSFYKWNEEELEWVLETPEPAPEE